MSVLINFKICDNAEDCSGAAACPFHAIAWNNKKNTLEIDNSRCHSCGACENACMVGAVHVARTDKEYNKLKKEIEEDPRKVSDLFIDRYGAMPINEAFITKPQDFEREIESYPKLAVVEIYDNASIECLLRSIPVKELFAGVEARYRKVEATPELKKKHEINKLPALLFINDGKPIGKIEGYFPSSDRAILIDKVANILREFGQKII